MKSLLLISSTLATIISLVCCTSNTSQQNNNITVTEEIQKSNEGEDDFKNAFDTVNKGLPIFYNMYLTVDMSSLFETVGADFDPTLLTPAENCENHVVSSKKALNLGIYSVDLIYTRLYNKNEASTKYFNSMSTLASGLRIPHQHITDVMERFENNVSNKDSIYAIANDVYISTDNYLKENDREGAANLILLGGWIEAMYLASEIYEKEGKDVQILDRFVDQKHSLEIIIGLLEENKNEAETSKYLKHLSPLNEKFKKLTIDYDNPDSSYDLFKSIKTDIGNIRADIVS